MRCYFNFMLCFQGAVCAVRYVTEHFQTLCPLILKHSANKNEFLHLVLGLLFLFLVSPCKICKVKIKIKHITECVRVCTRGEVFFFPFIIVNDRKAPASFFKRLSQKSLTAASRRNSEMPNQHFVIGIRKLHPLCNNMFLFGELPDGLLPI